VAPKNKIPRILHVCETAHGGLSTYLNTLVGQESGTVRSRVIVPDAHEYLLPTDVERRTFPYPRRSVISIVLLVRASLVERFLFKPDIIFFHSSFALLVMLLLRPMSLNIKFIYCAHGWAATRETSHPMSNRVAAFIEGRVCGLADRVVNISQTELTFATSRGYRGKHIVIENAVRVARDPSGSLRFTVEQACINLLFVGRLDRQKGLDILLSAFEKAQVSNPALKLFVVGASVLTEGNQPGCFPGVTFLGWVHAEEIDQYYAAVDLVVVPSRWEGFGLVVAEAYRNGTPVLTSNRGALPSLVEDGTTGYVVPLGIDTFAASLASLDKQSLLDMRGGALALFNSRFHVDRFRTQILNLYAELLR
jgi:glycosyltransferase involved in cell wall biosynthesis